jgi:hypothetical protein
LDVSSLKKKKKQNYYTNMFFHGYKNEELDSSIKNDKYFKYTPFYKYINRFYSLNLNKYFYFLKNKNIYLNFLKFIYYPYFNYLLYFNYNIYHLFYYQHRELKRERFRHVIDMNLSIEEDYDLNLIDYLFKFFFLFYSNKYNIKNQYYINLYNIDFLYYIYLNKIKNIKIFLKKYVILCDIINIYIIEKMSDQFKY